MRQEGTPAAPGIHPSLGASLSSRRLTALKPCLQPLTVSLGAPRGPCFQEGTTGPCSPHLCQLYIRQSADQVPREGDNRMRLALERGRTAGHGQQPDDKRGQEECHGSAVAGGMWLCWSPLSALGAAGLPAPIYGVGGQ